MTTAISKFNFEITSLDQAMQYAKLISDSDLAPKDYRGKPGNVLIAMQFGAEIGLKPMQAIQNIAVINGRPCVWGDAMIAIVQNHPMCEYIKEGSEPDGTTYCTVKRKNEEEEYTIRFSKEDAKKANLLGKPGPWTQYPQRMMQMRARAFALRDKFSDVLKGLSIAEEVQDYVIETKEIKTADKLNKLLVKTAPISAPLTIAEILYRMDTASDLEELNAVAALAKELSEEEKEFARDCYKELKKKYTSSMNEQNGEVIENE